MDKREECKSKMPHSNEQQRSEPTYTKGKPKLKQDTNKSTRDPIYPLKAQMPHTLWPKNEILENYNKFRLKEPPLPLNDLGTKPTYLNQVKVDGANFVFV